MARLIIPSSIRRSFRDRTATFTWGNSTVKYAKYVHSNPQNRPWTEQGLKQCDIAAIVAKEFNADPDLTDAFRKAMIELGDTFTEIIDDHDWGKEGVGKKKHRNGRTMSKITDSGALAKSQKLRLS